MKEPSGRLIYPTRKEELKKVQYSSWGLTEILLWTIVHLVSKAWHFMTFICDRHLSNSFILLKGESHMILFGICWCGKSTPKSSEAESLSFFLICKKTNKKSNQTSRKQDKFPWGARLWKIFCLVFRYFELGLPCWQCCFFF